jgi:putative tricarboxylic transport membrane protein
VLLAAGFLFAGGDSDKGKAAGTAAPAASKAFVDNEPVEKFPSRPIEVVSQYGHGGGTDMFIRTIAVDGSRFVGQSIVPIAVTGGGGVGAWERFKSSVPDGYTLFALGPEQVIMNNFGMIKLLDELQPLVRCQLDIFLYFSRTKDNRFATIEDVIKEAKANPGKLTMAGTNAASYDEVHLGLFCKEMGINIKYVPYVSASEAFAAVLGGHVDLVHEEVGPALGLMKSNDLRPLIVFIDKDKVDHPAIAHVPTSQSKGWSKEIAMGRWRGFGITKGTNPEKMKKIITALEKAMKGSIYSNMEKESMLDVRPGFMGPDQFTEFLKGEVTIYKGIMDSLGMKRQ